MGVSLEKTILAVVTTEPGRVGGGAPIFFVRDEAELQRVSFTLEKILDGIAHEVRDGTVIIVKHA